MLHALDRTITLLCVQKFVTRSLQRDEQDQGWGMSSCSARYALGSPYGIASLALSAGMPEVWGRQPGTFPAFQRKC